MNKQQHIQLKYQHKTLKQMSFNSKKSEWLDCVHLQTVSKLQNKWLVTLIWTRTHSFLRNTKHWSLDHANNFISLCPWLQSSEKYSMKLSIFLKVWSSWNVKFTTTSQIESRNQDKTTQSVLKCRHGNKLNKIK